ncbi:NADH dehydrogenase [ubiquinone] 1 alpha subcomplex assembly factor 3 [Manduca sexta]|uniref:NADH dehydrogenase [ubiquinone] 1 alpha subcomplex assembly factor 3 n=1 Tax=Manduca sexta TaxID=7130 RepID=UPI0011844D71|nr:NADH dehydrogenase [ubiquinone] 1 alpha subcomplex assembly factor 3 [Manduca sexta]
MLRNKIRQINNTVKANMPNMSFVRTKAAYEGEGKTTIRVLNQDQELGLMIDSYATYGFKLNNGLTVLGPMAIFPRSVLSWQVRDSEEVTEESLRLFKILEPKIDLLVMGLESGSRAAAERVYRAARAARLNVEILPSEHACSTFNFLSAEGRSVAGALIPPQHVVMSEDDMLAAKLHYGDGFNTSLRTNTK